MSSSSSTGPPTYLYVIGGALGVSGLGGAFYWVVACEPGIRYRVEELCPPVIEVLRERVGFKDEDLEQRKAARQLKTDLFSNPATVRSGAQSIDLDPHMTVGDACKVLNNVHHLTVTVDDLPTVETTDDEPTVPVTDLEKALAGVPSLWAQPEVIDTAAQLKDLDDRRTVLQSDFTSGRRQYDDVAPEIKAIDQRQKDLKTTKRFFFFW